MTWKDIKIATLQKMFSADGANIPTDQSTIDYVAAMPYAANEGMQRLCTAGKYLRKCYLVPEEGRTGTVDLRTIPDFYSAGSTAEVYKINGGVPEALRECRMVAGRYLVMPSAQGEIQFYYNAWPPDITQGTPDDYVIPLDPEVAVLLPKYIASQLYTDSEAEVATRYYNEFEIGLAALENSVTGESGGEFVSVTGWC
ncbi:MAG: hypothetical protein RSD27_10370 [Ruthenibacterium sp.]